MSNNRLHPTIAFVTLRAGARTAPNRLRRARLQVKPTLGHLVSKERNAVVKVFVFIASLMSVSGMSLGMGPYEPLKAGEYKSQDVFFQVSFSAGLEPTSVLRMSCDGRYSVTREEETGSSVQGYTDPESVLVLVNRLLAINFFDFPEKYRAGFKQLVFIGGSKLAYNSSYLWDSGKVRVHLQVGPRSHSVVLKHPAHGAPEKLLEWIEEARKLKDKFEGG